jgi:hypothetical protein
MDPLSFIVGVVVALVCAAAVSKWLGRNDVVVEWEPED